MPPDDPFVSPPPWSPLASGTANSQVSVDPEAPIVTRQPKRRGFGASRSDSRRDRSITNDLDLIVPASIDRTAIDYLRSGQSYTRSFAVLTLPRMLKPGVLYAIMQMPGVQTALVNNPIPRSIAKERLTQLARQMGVSLHQGGDQGIDEVLALKDVRRVLAQISEEQSALHLVGLYITIAAADRAQLEERTRALRTACTDIQIQIVATDAQHWEGLLTTLPLGYDQLRYLFETDTPTLARLLPSASATLQSGHGVPILYGVRAEGTGAGQITGAPVLLDRYTLHSPHQATIAATGGGKTYQQSFALLQRFAHGNCDICVLDPKDQEYRYLLETVMGGTYLVLSDQSDIQLNPLALPWGDKAIVQRLQQVQIDVRARRASLVKQLVASESIARGMPLSGSAEAKLEEAILACYEQRGISTDPATFHADVPDVRAVVTYLTEHDDDPALESALELFTQGTLGRLLHGNNPLPLAIPSSSLRSDVGVLGIDLSAFVQGQDQTLQRVLPALITDYFMTVAMRGTNRKMELIIDEAWAVLNTAAGAQTIEMLARIGRSLGVAVTVITQQIREFLYRRVGDQLVPNSAGATFLDNCETILLLRQLRPSRPGSQDDDNPIAQVAKKLSLTPGEINWLSRCRRDSEGVTGLLIVGREPIPLRIPRAPAPIHSLIPGTTPISGTSTVEEFDVSVTKAD